MGKITTGTIEMAWDSESRLPQLGEMNTPRRMDAAEEWFVLKLSVGVYSRIRVA